MKNKNRKLHKTTSSECEGERENGVFQIRVNKVKKPVCVNDIFRRKKHSIKKELSRRKKESTKIKTDKKQVRLDKLGFDVLMKTETRATKCRPDRKFNDNRHQSMTMRTKF